MMKWPENPKELVSMSDALEQIKKSILFAYKLTRINVGKAIPYKGYEAPSEFKVRASDFDQQLSVEGQEYNRDQNRDPLDVLLMIAYNIGFENGARHTKHEETMADLLRRTNELLSQQAKDIKS